MTEPSLDNQINQDHLNPLAHPQKLYVLTILVIITIISQLPWFVGRFMLVEDYTSKNDLMVFLVLPSLSFLLMLICPIFAARIKPTLAGFNTTWFQKTRSEIVWLFLLPLIALVSTATVRSLMKQLGVPLTGSILFLSSSTVFFIAYTFRIALVGPIVEEIFWRGYVQDRLGKIFGSRIALFTQAIVFAAMHLRPIGGFFDAFVYGLIFGVWRWRRKSLLPIIITHIIINSFFCANLWYNRAELSKINIKTDYVAQFKEISRPANYDPNDNAEPHYQKAFELYVEQPEHLSKSDRKGWPKDLPEDKQVLLKDWVSANKNALERLKLGTQKSYYWREYQGRYMYDILPDGELKKSRMLAYAISLRAKLNATKGNFKEAFSDLSACYQFGLHWTGPKTLIEQLVGIAIDGLAIQTGFQILEKTKPAPNLLEDFQQQLQTLSSRKKFVIDFTSDKFSFYDNIQRTFTDDGKGGGYIPKITIEQIKDPPPYLRLLLSADMSEEQKAGWEKLERRQTTELVGKVFEYLNSAKRKTPAQLHNEGEALQQVVEEMTNANPFLLMLMPAVERVLQISFRHKAETDALITTVGLLRYRADKGELPGNLEQLVAAEYLKTVPVDPFSGSPLIYKRLENNFILYSFAHDCDDDDGRHDPKWARDGDGDYVFWPVEKPKKKAR